ncbi:MAG: M20/M25/M40 family metallo-hydrolase [Planctomycetaceae bacterium]
MTNNSANNEIDADAAVRLVMELLSVSGKSGEEQHVADVVIKRLVEAGVPRKSIASDSAHRKSRLGGQLGNLIVKLPGTVKGPRRLLMAHLDTVPLCVGAQPVLQNGVIVSRDPRTALGGDNRAGCAVVLNAAVQLLRNKLPHPPLTLLWTVQEEVGLLGARHLSTSKIGKPQLCFNWDGGPPQGVVLGATGDVHMDIEVAGLASHAGAHPEDGISAVAIAGLAIADLQQQGWHGKVVKGKQQGSSNIGFVNGGAATNVVTDRLTLRAEARSHNSRFRKRIVDAYETAFQQAAAKVRSAAGQSGRVTITTLPKYEAFRLSTTDPSARAAKAAIESVGLTPFTRIIDGGLDANWMTAHGFPTATLGCGQADIHTTRESLHIEEFLQACRIALQLAVGEGKP